MDLAHLHLSLTHVPIIGVIFGFLILLISSIAGSKGATRVGLGLLVLSAIIAVPVYLTGESAEEIVERLPGFSEAVTEQHKTAAAWALGLVIASGIAGLAALLLTGWQNTKAATLSVIAALLVSFLTTTSMVRTANLGGQIRHTEIRADAQNTGQHSETGTDKQGSSKKDDD